MATSISALERAMVNWMIFGMFVLASMAVGTSHAGMILTLDDTSTAGVDVTVTDNGSGDLNPGVGVITFNGPVASNFNINVTTGISKPVIGDPSDARLDLNSVNVNSVGAGRLEIMLTDTDFSLSGSNSIWESRMAGVADALVEWEQILDPDNLEFGVGVNAMTLSGSAGLGPFNDTQTASFLPAGPFSLTERVLISNVRASQTTTFDFESKVTVPEPATLALMSLGLAGVGFSRRKTR